MFRLKTRDGDICCCGCQEQLVRKISRSCRKPEAMHVSKCGVSCFWIAVCQMISKAKLNTRNIYQAEFVAILVEFYCFNC